MQTSSSTFFSIIYIFYFDKKYIEYYYDARDRYSYFKSSEFSETRFARRNGPSNFRENSMDRIRLRRIFSVTFSIPRPEIPFCSKWSFTPPARRARRYWRPWVCVRAAHWEPRIVDAATAAAAAAAAAAKLAVISVRQQSWLTGWPSNRPSSGCCCCCRRRPLQPSPSQQRHQLHEYYSLPLLPPLLLHRYCRLSPPPATVSLNSKLPTASSLRSTFDAIPHILCISPPSCLLRSATLNHCGFKTDTRRKCHSCILENCLDYVGYFEIKANTSRLDFFR